MQGAGTPPPESAGGPPEPKEAPVGRVAALERAIEERDAEIARLKRQLAERGREAVPLKPFVSSPKPGKVERGNGQNKGQVIAHGAMCQCWACRAHTPQTAEDLEI